MISFREYYHNKPLQYVTLIVFWWIFVFLLFKNDQPENCDIEPAQPVELLDIDESAIPLWGASLYVSPANQNNIVMTDELVIAAKYCGEIVAFHLDTGRIVWETAGLRTPFNLVVDSNADAVYFAETNALTALSISTGRIRWRNESKAFDHRSIVPHLVEGEQLILEVYGRGMYPVDRETGTIFPKLDDELSFPDDDVSETPRLIAIHEDIMAIYHPEFRTLSVYQIAR